MTDLTSRQPLSYHDVVVYAQGKDGMVRAYRLFDACYDLRLTCTRAGGWELWRMLRPHEQLLGGEFLGPSFCVAAAGIPLCGSIPETFEWSK